MIQKREGKRLFIKICCLGAGILILSLFTSCGRREGSQLSRAETDIPAEDVTLLSSPLPPAEGTTTSPDMAGTNTTSQSPISSQPGDNGTAENGNPKQDILTETEEILNLFFDTSLRAASIESESTENLGRTLNVQFYQGEPVLLWLKDWECSIRAASEDGQLKEELLAIPDGGLYLYRMDGSRELLIPGHFMKENYWMKVDGGKAAQFSFHLDSQGNCYGRTTYADENGRYSFIKIDQTGEILYKSVIEPDFAVKDFCESSDGKTYVVLRNLPQTADTTITKIVEFNPETGTLSQAETFCYQTGRISADFGAGTDGLYCRTPAGYYKINEKEGASEDFMTFQGTSYTRWTTELGWKTDDFRVLADGSIEILNFKEDFVDGKWNCKVVKEKLWLSDSHKTPVSIRASAFSPWLKSQASLFNRINDKYQIVLEEFISGSNQDLAEYARLTSVELATGKGPDILYGDLMTEYICGIIEKEAFLDIKPYMDASGILEENYLPFTFEGLKNGEKVYGIYVQAHPRGYQIKADVLRGSSEITIETLMDSLSAWEENATYYSLYDAKRLLEPFLEGSDSLWGMIDWEKGSCGFQNELFVSILENARRYGYNERNNYPTLVRAMNYDNIYQYDSLAESGANGMIPLGFLTDGSCRGAVNLQGIMAINANSAQKEGAWEFILFLLTDEAQLARTSDFPVSRTALPTWIKSQIANVSDGQQQIVGVTYIDKGEILRSQKVYTASDISEERIAEYLDTLERIKPLPLRTRPILAIVYEEAENYFNGAKSIQDIIPIIENRVQLYLDENN